MSGSCHPKRLLRFGRPLTVKDYDARELEELAASEATSAIAYHKGPAAQYLPRLVLVLLLLCMQVLDLCLCCHGWHTIAFSAARRVAPERGRLV